MCPHLSRAFYTAVFLCMGATAGFSSPVDFKLLPLVPPGAQMVAGFQNGPGIHKTRALILTTHNNRIDLDDFLSLAGVDSKRFVDEVIQVSFSLSGNQLGEHLLLLDGRFNRELIFHSAELNGAQRINYCGETLLIIAPLARERAEMADMRWLAILDDHMSVFGTPALVKKALDRFHEHSLSDPLLMQRLALFRHDVNGWNVLTSVHQYTQTLLLFSHTAWHYLFEDADLLLVGTQNGSKVRVDFLLNPDKERGAVDLKLKVAQFGQVFALGTTGRDASLHSQEPPLKNVLVEKNRVQASIELSNEQFIEWNE